VKKKKRNTASTKNTVVVLETRTTMLTSVDQVRENTSVAPALVLVGTSAAVKRAAVARLRVIPVDKARDNAMVKSQDLVADSKTMAVKNHTGKGV
jgi:hypothetical protein